MREPDRIANDPTLRRELKFQEKPPSSSDQDPSSQDTQAPERPS